MNQDKRIKELEGIIERQAAKIFMLYSVKMLAKCNYQLRQDILSVCKERDQVLRKVVELENEVKMLTNQFE
jgi:hypothetical protein